MIFQGDIFFLKFFFFFISCFHGYQQIIVQHRVIMNFVLESSCTVLINDDYSPAIDFNPGHFSVD